MDEPPAEDAADAEEAAAVLRLHGDVDALTQAAYRRAAEGLFAVAPNRMVVDLRDVGTIDSSGLGLLVHLHARARETGTGMALANIPPRVQALLRRTGLDLVFATDAN